MTFHPRPAVQAEDEEEPNDSYVEQLTACARAAVEELQRRGVSDPSRIAVAGHSYGAFMTANLLAHAGDLFACGIARSGARQRRLPASVRPPPLHCLPCVAVLLHGGCPGLGCDSAPPYLPLSPSAGAYNRTLTPFGFQAEERTYWQVQCCLYCGSACWDTLQSCCLPLLRPPSLPPPYPSLSATHPPSYTPHKQAPETYHTMSPFTHADKIKKPLLLIHGEADNNTGAGAHRGRTQEPMHCVQPTAMELRRRLAHSSSSICLIPPLPSICRHLPHAV